MYQLIITYGSHTYSMFGNSTDIRDYPNICIGSYVWIPQTEDLFYVNGSLKGIDLDDSEESLIPSTSIFGQGVMGNIIFGEE